MPSHARPAYPFPLMKPTMGQREIAAFLFAASRAVPHDFVCARQDMALKRAFKRVRREGLTKDVLWHVGKVLDGISQDIADRLYRPRMMGERFRPKGLFKYQSGYGFPLERDYWYLGAACAEASLAIDFPEVATCGLRGAPKIVDIVRPTTVPV